MQAFMIWGDLWNDNLWALVIILPYNRCTLLMLQGCTQLPCSMEVAADAARWQTVISAFSTPMFCFPSPHAHSRGPHFMLCSLPHRTAPHGACTSLRCRHDKRWVSLPKLDSRAVPCQGSLCTDFHFVPLKLAHRQQGWRARAAPCLQGPRGRAWLCLQGHSSTDKRRHHPAFCHLYRHEIWQLHFNQIFCLSCLFHPCERSSMTSSAVPQQYWSHSPYSWANPKSPFHVNFHLRFLQHGIYRVILKLLHHDLWEMWLILEKMLLKLSSDMTLLTYCWKPAIPSLHISFLSWH